LRAVAAGALPRCSRLDARALIAQAGEREHEPSNVNGHCASADAASGCGRKDALVCYCRVSSRAALMRLVSERQ
jgi:hypothetical protein